ncbi:MAG: Flp pilus assembly protein CpaB, partial [Geobacteraceae bacterium]|nr:Flp pilus assembly protein CpaB [Geobacteraceae bacterium]
MTRPGAVAVVSVVALIFAGLASWGVYNYLQQETKKTKVAETDKTVVAAADLPIGTKLNATQVKMASWPKESRPQGSYADTSLVVDRVVVRQIAAGEAVTEQKLLPKDIKAGAGIMTYIVPEGHRAVTVGVNEVAGVAGFLSPGNRVDVVLSTQIPNSTPPENISKIVLQDVPILATGQIATEQKDGKPVIVPTVTLDLTPEDAEKLILASTKGSLQLLLRNVIDNKPAETKGATIIKVLGGVERSTPPVSARKAARPSRPAAAKTAPVKQPPPPPPPYTVE